jgi:hypothetical protein
MPSYAKLSILCPFLVTQDPQTGKGREYGVKVEHKYDYFAIFFKNILAFTILQG